MNKIEGREKSLSDLLSSKKYTIHYYQREYRWGYKQIQELISDLTDEFMNNYRDEDERWKVEKYGFYYMGSVILTGSDEGNAIIDGQQRLTSITLLLIYLNNIQHIKDDKDIIDIQTLIYSEKFGKKSFNLNVDERNNCLDALLKGVEYDLTNEKSDSVKTIVARYQDIKDIFPEDIIASCLPHFIEWLIYKVYFVEINANTEQDAHKVFVTMNDRGLSLTPTEMLKGFLLSEIENDSQRNKANDLWKDTIRRIKEINSDAGDMDDDFIKNWLRAQYAQTIRETKKGSVPLDFDLIGTEFHKWVLTHSKEIGLSKPAHYEDFLLIDFKKFSDIYIRLRGYSVSFTPGFEYVYYNANRGFTLQYQLILSVIDRDDDKNTVDRKIKIISCFIDQYITRRVVNFKMVEYSTIKNAVFNLTKKFRRLTVDVLKKAVTDELLQSEFTLEGIKNFSITNFTVRYLLHMLARITYFIELNSSVPNASFVKYVDREQKNSFDIEHILGDNFAVNSASFQEEDEFRRYRNKFGALIILPKDINRSIQDDEYNKKLKAYIKQNMLAQTLHSDCYCNNPQFLAFMNSYNLNFKSYSDFGKNAITERQELYLEIAKLIWDAGIITTF